MFKVSEIEMAHRAIFTSGSKHADVLSKADIIDRLIVGNQLGLHDLFFDVPDSACGVNTGRADHIQVLLIPVYASQRSAEFGLLFE